MSVRFVFILDMKNITEQTYTSWC